MVLFTIHGKAKDVFKLIAIMGKLDTTLGEIAIRQSLN